MVSFVCRRVISGVCSILDYCPYICVDRALAVTNDFCESRLCEIREPLHQCLVEGGVVAPRGGVGVGVGDVSSGSVSFDIMSCGREVLGEALLGLVESGAGVADGDCDELYLPPYGVDDGDEGFVLGGLLLKLGMASEVPAKADLDKDEVALVAVEGGRVRRWGDRYPLGVDRGRGRSVAAPE